MNRSNAARMAIQCTSIVSGSRCRCLGVKSTGHAMPNWHTTSSWLTANDRWFLRPPFLTLSMHRPQPPPGTWSSTNFVARRNPTITGKLSNRQAYSTYRLRCKPAPLDEVSTTHDKPSEFPRRRRRRPFTGHSSMTTDDVDIAFVEWTTTSVYSVDVLQASLDSPACCRACDRRFSSSTDLCPYEWVGGWGGGRGELNRPVDCASAALLTMLSRRSAVDRRSAVVTVRAVGSPPQWIGKCRSICRPSALHLHDSLRHYITDDPWMISDQSSLYDDTSQVVEANTHW